jgi:hypothetical protein
LVFSEAVRKFWETREKQAEAQKRRQIGDQGARSAVTGGQQMNGFAHAIIDVLKSAGVREDDIFYSKDKTLPGFFRATKDWDLLVVSGGQLLVAIELKSQVGPSFGNNFNNRSEEALGTAVDLWTAYREGMFQVTPRPWLGYLFLLEDCPPSRRSVRSWDRHFPVREEFAQSSYSKRYEILCRKLVLERHYDTACFLMSESRRARLKQNYSEPADDLSASQFFKQMLVQVSGAGAESR